MSALPDEPSFADLYDPTPTAPVDAAPVVDIARSAPDGFGARFAQAKLAKSTLSPETFPIRYGKPDRYNGVPYFTIIFPDSDYTIDRIDREDDKYNFPTGRPTELYWYRGKESQSRYAAGTYTALAEGQIKAAALERATGLSTVGINGCHGWGEKLRTVSKQVEHTTVKPQIISGLGPNRFHLVCMDGDWSINEQVERALGTYCTEVALMGSEPIVPDFGFVDGDRLGVDDWLFKTFGPTITASPDEVLRRILALPRVPWQQLRVQGSFYSSDIERFNRGYIDFTDRGNATFLLRIYGPGNLRYLADTKEWACFGDELNGDDPEVNASKTWKLYPEKALELVNPAALQRKHHAERLFQNVRTIEDGVRQGRVKPADDAVVEKLRAEAAELFKSYIELSGNRARQAVLTDLSTRDEVRTTRATFDANVGILNTPDGVIELDTGRIRPARRDDYVLNCTDVCYSEIEPTEHPDPAIAADAAKMKRGVMEALSAGHGVPDPEMVKYHLRRMGASLRAECALTALEIFHGEGGTAKSSIVMTTLKALGSYGVVVPAGVVLSAFANQNPEAATPFAMLLVGKRIAVISETKDTAVLDDAKLKMLSGGDVLALRGNYKDGGNYQATVTIILVTNNIPSCRALDKALVDRLAITPFRCRWNRPDKIILSAGDDQLPSADKWFINEARQSVGAKMWLLWAYVQGGVEYVANGHAVGIRPQAVVDVVTTYVAEQDEISLFFNDGPYRLHVATDGNRDHCKVLSGLIYFAYSEFVKQRGGMPPNASVFSKRLKERFPQITVTRIGGKSYIVGVLRRPDSD